MSNDDSIVHEPLGALPSRQLPKRLSDVQTSKQKAPAALKDALKVQLQGILDKDLTPRSLLELEQTAALAHKLLIVAGDPRAMPTRRGMGMMNGAFGNIPDVVGPDDLDLGVAGPGMLPLAPSPFGENFGAEAIRNLLSQINQPRIDDLMRSLDIARKMEDKEVEARIKAVLDERLASMEGATTPHEVDYAKIAAAQAVDFESPITEDQLNGTQDDGGQA